MTRTRIAWFKTRLRRTRRGAFCALKRLFLPAVLVASMASVGCQAAPVQKPDPSVPAAPAWPDAFVSPAAVQAIATEGAFAPGHQARIVVLDTRERGDYLAGHIPHARHVAWTDYRDGLSPTNGRLQADLDDAAAKLAAQGVDRAHRVLVCGGARNMWGEEGRIAWMLRVLGHPAVAILDGGCDAWRRAGGAWDKGEATTQVGRFWAAVDRRSWATQADVEQVLRVGNAALLDVRTREEYDGAVLYFEARGGHIPGATHLHFADVMDAEGRVLPTEALRGLLKGAGVEPGTSVIVYCTGGIRAAFVTEALRAAGIDARNYDGSFWEWAADARLPVAGP